MRESGVAIDVTEGIARIVMDAAGHAQCGACGLCRRAADGRSVTMELPAPAHLQAGDRVVVEIPGPGAGVSAALLLGLPLFLFVAGVILGELLRWRGVVALQNWFSALFGFLLMGLGFLAVSLYDRHLRRAPNLQPRIVDWPDKNAADLDS